MRLVNFEATVHAFSRNAKKRIDNPGVAWYYLKVMILAIVVQLVVRHLAKVEVAGSSPVYRFFCSRIPSNGVLLLYDYHFIMSSCNIGLILECS